VSLPMGMPKIQFSLLMLCHLLVPMAVSLQGEPFFLANLEVQKGYRLVDLADEDDQAFLAKQAYSVYLLTDPSSDQAVEWVISVDQTDSGWEEFAAQRNWKKFSMSDRHYFFRADSQLAGIWPSVEPKLPVSTSAYGVYVRLQSMNGWADALRAIESTENGTLSLASLEPWLGQFQVSWLLRELIDLKGFNLETRLTPGMKTSSIRLQAESGTELHRWLRSKTWEEPKVLEYVPADADPVYYGLHNSVATSNYLEHLSNRVEELDSPFLESFETAIEGVDSEMFRRWDGTWVSWSPSDSTAKLLLLGGRFLLSDLEQLFDSLDLLSGVDGRPVAELDRDNTLVGFSRIRSVELNSLPVGILDDKVYYLAVANGFLAISDDSSSLINLVFKLNSRTPEADSYSDQTSKSTRVRAYQILGGERRSSLEAHEGEMVIYKQGGLNLMESLLAWVFDKRFE